MGSFCSALFGQSQTTTTAPPEAIKTAISDILTRAAKQSNQQYPTYSPTDAAKYLNYVPGLVAPMTPNQIAAGNAIANLAGYTDPNFAAATALATQAATPLQMQRFSRGAVDQYMNPYMSDVVNAAVQNINETNAQQQQQVLGSAIGQGAYGGDRAGIAQAELARQQNLANNATIANLLNQGYTNAQNMFTNQQATDLSTQLQNRDLLAKAGINLANLGTQGQQAAIQQAQTQYGYGTAEQQQQQAGLSTAYQQWLNQQMFPYQQLSYYSGLASGAAPAMGGTTTGYTPTVSPAAGFIGGVSMLGNLSNAASSTNNPFGAGWNALTSGGNLFGMKSGGRVGYAEGGVPVVVDPSQAYNDYVELASSGKATYAQLNAAYKRYLDSFKGAAKPWEDKTTTTTTTTPTTDSTTTTDTSTTSTTPVVTDKSGSNGSDAKITPEREGRAGSGDTGGAVDEYGDNPRAGDEPGFGTPGAGGGYGTSGAKSTGLMSGLGDVLKGAYYLTNPVAGVIAALNQDPKKALERYGDQYVSPNKTALPVYDDKGNRVSTPNTASGQSLKDYMDQFGITDPSKVRVGTSYVNGYAQPEFFVDSAMGRAVHPGSVPASEVSQIMDQYQTEMRTPEENEELYTSEGGADLPARKEGLGSLVAASSGNPYKGMSPSEFMDAIRDDAQRIADKTGIDARVIMAQAANETGYGQHMVGGNLFGIKGAGTQAVETTENLPGEGNVKTKASFAAFPNQAAAFDAYADLMGNKRYSGVVSGKTLADQISALGKSGYATDPDYASKIGSIAKKLDYMTVPSGVIPGSSLGPQGSTFTGLAKAPNLGVPVAEPAAEPIGLGDLGGLDRTASEVDETPVEPGSSLGPRGSTYTGGHGDRETSDTGGSDESETSGGYSPEAGSIESRSNYTGGYGPPGSGENRGGRIHKANAGAISMQYGMPTEEDLQHMIASFAGSGVGDLSPQLRAMASKGVLLSRNGGRIHAKDGAAIPADDESFPGLESELLPVPPPSKSAFQRRSEALQKAGEESRIMQRGQKEYTAPIGPVIPKNYKPEPVVEAPKEISPGDFFKGKDPTPVLESIGNKPSVQMEAAPARTEPVLPRRYMSPPPKDLTDFFGMNYGLGLLSGQNLAAAGNAYAANIMAQQNQQREQMEAEQRTRASQATELQTRKLQTPTGLAEVYEGPQGQLLYREVPEAGQLPGLPGVENAVPSKINDQDLSLGPVYVGEDVPATSANKTKTLQQMGSVYKKQGLGSNAATLNKSYQEMMDAAQQEATAAQNTSTDLSQAIQESAKLGSSKFLTPGAAIGLRTTIANYLNTLNNMAGNPIDTTITAENLTSQQVLGKISTLQAQAQQRGLGREAGFWLNTLKQAYPNESMTKEAANDLLANMIVSNGRAKERAGVYTIYGNASGRMGVDAPQAFEKVNPGKLYAADIRAISDILNRTIRMPDGRMMNMITALQLGPENGGMSREMFDKTAKEKYHVANLSRYF